MSSGRKNAARRARRFAWDSISFDLPKNWDLAEYRFRKRAARVEFEDEYAIRLQAEWVRPKHKLDIGKTDKRLAKAAKHFLENAKEDAAIELPETYWHAHRYTMPDGVKLVNISYSDPHQGVVAYFHLYFHPKDSESSVEIARQISSTFTCHTGANRPWAIYDMAFELSEKFRLVNTSLQIGCRLLVFEWRLRRFFLWHVSFAEQVLKGQSAAEWGAGFLNEFRMIRGPIFEADGNDITVRHNRRRYPFRYFEEIGRMCFRYQAGVTHDPSKNVLVLWAYHYRGDKDLEWLPSLSAPSTHEPSASAHHDDEMADH